MTAPRALIAEDEPLLATALKTALAEAWPVLDVIHVARNGSEALEQLLALKPEIAFLDIRMPGLSGLEVAEELADRLPAGARAPLLVFVTAYGEFAVEAFEQAAADYVLKPVSVERLTKMAARLQERLAAPAAGLDALAASLRPLLAPAAPATAMLRHIQAGAGSTVKMIPVESVLCFRASDKYTEVVTAQGASLIRTPLKELIAQLPPERFRQVHRGTVVNLDAVEAATRDDAGRVSLRLRGQAGTIAVSRVYADLFRPM
ncbi:MAG: LytTR family DNA-binding domain-containing protein [Proteobacteria bacterium]|nr:LytTR family DNA-binding domain-containing protein [Pseudomonadota bacterium]